ncbi:phage baseplate assembly protein [Rhizobium johnstonii]|uniref:phage baseplate assembly protein domain-containing protein n=1 Tax=Rhizobium johnstonii TaxID=3019933 RepID=UPI003F9BE767
MSGRRIELDGENVEKGGQQFVSGRGLFSDGYTRIHRIEPHGFASMPVKGAKAFLLQPNGDADQAYVFGGEHPSHRPSDLPGGGTAIYDATGNIIKFVGSGIVIDAASRTVTVTAGTWTLNGDFVLNGDLQVNGNINASGSIIDAGGNTAHHTH